jgi:hypothetical protein
MEYAWSEAVLGAMFPRSARIPVGVEDMDLRGYLVDSLARIPLEAALGMRIAVWMVIWSPPLVLRKFDLFHTLAHADRMRLLVLLAKSPVYLMRQLSMALKAHVSMLYARDPRVVESIFGSTEAPVAARRLPLVNSAPTRQTRNASGAERASETQA